MDWEKRPNIMAAQDLQTSPLKLFLWGYVKDRMYRTPVRDLGTLQSRIINVLPTTNEEKLENTWREI